MSKDEKASSLREAIKTKSPEYIELKPKWDKGRIIYKGEDAVHDAGTLLLPALEQQTTTMYDAYVERTRFFNAFKRTVAGMEGTVKRKPADTELQPIDEYSEDIDTAGTTIDEYSNKLLHEGIKVGVCGTLVDFNYTFSNQDEEMTVAQAEALNLRPKLCFYLSDNIFYPHYGVVSGKKQLVQVVLAETYQHWENEFEVEEKVQYRVLRLDDDGYYYQQLYKETGESDLDVSEPVYPEMNGARMKTIPFFIHGEFVEPPLYDLITNNIKHYQLKADHNHFLHFIGLPQPWRTGVDPEDNRLPTSLGPDIIWDIESPEAQIGFLELTGKGLEHIENELETIKQDMAFLGAAMLASDKMANETATKANYRNASDTATLADIVINLSDTFTKALQFFSEWAGKAGDVYYEYNKDFDITKLTADEIIKRVQAWQSGGFSKRSLDKQLRDGEVEMASETFEEEQELINKGE